MNMNRWRGTHQLFGVVMMCGSVFIVLLFIVCWRIHHRAVAGSPGFPDSLAFFIASAYAPVIGATFVGYRDAVVAMLPQNEPPKAVPLRAGVFFYPYALSGVVAAVGALVYIATGVDEMVAKWFIAVSATYWGATVGYVFDKLFKGFTVPAAPVGLDSQALPVPPAPGAGGRVP
ncbi:MAG: hypothetical protein ACMG6S_10340 [Byssovorax sp.]